jgi:hypothetical protein
MPGDDVPDDFSAPTDVPRVVEELEREIVRLDQLDDAGSSPRSAPDVAPAVTDAEEPSG